MFLPSEDAAFILLQSVAPDGSSPPPSIRIYVLSLAHALLEYGAAESTVRRIVALFRQARIMCRYRRWVETAAVFPFKTAQRNLECDAILQAMRQEDPETARFAPLFLEQAEYYQAKLEDFIQMAAAAVRTVADIWPSARAFGCEAATIKQAALDMDKCAQCRGPLVPGKPCRLCAVHFFPSPL